MSGIQDFGIGLPKEILRFQPPETIQVRIGEIQPTRSGDKTKPVPLDYFLVKEMAGGNEGASHPAFAGQQPRELDIKLISDNPAGNIKSGISFWDGQGTPFCYNHEGGDEAHRRTERGLYRDQVCDRSKCVFWINSKCRGSAPPEVQDSLVEHAKHYKHAKITHDSVCTPDFYLYFLIPGITKHGEVARFYTQSENTIRQILSSLTLIGAQTNGIIAGLPLKLKIFMRTGRFKNLVPTVAITAATEDDEVLHQQISDAVERRALSGMDWHKLEAYISQKELLEEMGADSEYISQHFLQGEQREALPAPAEISPALITTDQQRLMQELLNNPKWQRLAKLAGLSSADKATLAAAGGWPPDPGDVEPPASLEVTEAANEVTESHNATSANQLTNEHRIGDEPDTSQTQATPKQVDTIAQIDAEEEAGPAQEKSTEPATRPGWVDGKSSAAKVRKAAQLLGLPDDDINKLAKGVLIEKVQAVMRERYPELEPAKAPEKAAEPAQKASTGEKPAVAPKDAPKEEKAPEPPLDVDF